MPRLRKFTGEGLLDALEGISYFVDLDGRIVAFGRTNWNQCAAENGAGDSLSEKHVVGRKLSDFISGDDVRKSYGALMQRLNAEPDEKIIIPLRCDSPAERRDMRLSISAVRSRGRLVGYLYVSTVISVKSRPRLNIFDFQSTTAPASQEQSTLTLTMCSYCQRLNYGEEARADWIEAPEYYRRGGTDTVRISHGICQGCLDRILGPQI